MELIAPGESIDDDLSFYRDHLGLSSQGQADPLPDSRAWIDHEGKLITTVRSREFATLVPLALRLASLIRAVGRIRPAVVSGVTIGADSAFRLGDLQDAAHDGRLVSGVVPFKDRRADNAV
ncbi:hypothetical protein [Planobispora takensis]|uniref:hypothetical protein n=1 Tax=Planobispora takensis TaxID=1367882 RepID=UPI001942FF30|nr:hypothetical protein [Planobispora takensis]